jgi:4-hydroxy-2-oxoheptanedioate aldolase
MALPGFGFARRLRAGETVFCGWCSMPYPIVAETIGRDGFVAVTLESQHGLWDMGAMLTGIAAVRQSGAAPLVRVPVGDFVMVSRVLDYGAEGVIAPMINTAADARAFVAAAKYPPIGERSWGPHRVTTLAGIADQSIYLHEANDNIITLAMIETTAALTNLEAILATPGIDGVFVGPADLSIALTGGKSLDPVSPEVDREIDRIIAAAQKVGKTSGVFCHSPERAVALAKRGARFLAVMSDLTLLRSGIATAMKVLKAG